VTTLWGRAVQKPIPTSRRPVRPNGSTYDHAALAALQREELATWRADTACERKYIMPVENKVRAQYEAQFRKQNLSLFSQAKPVR
jgi:hypothetical protein